SRAPWVGAGALFRNVGVAVAVGIVERTGAQVAEMSQFPRVGQSVAIGVAGDGGGIHGVGAALILLQIGEAVPVEVPRRSLAQAAKILLLPGIGKAVGIGVERSGLCVGGVAACGVFLGIGVAVA